MVGGQLQNKLLWRDLDQVTAHHERAKHGAHDADQIQREDHVLAVGRKKRGRKQRVDGQPCAAGHVGRHDGGEDPVRFVVQRAGRHDRRHVAAEADDQRHEGLARQAQPRSSRSTMNATRPM